MSKDSCAINRARMEREYHIERKVESMFDQLDKEYLETDMAPGEYNRRTQEIHEWAVKAYMLIEQGEY